MNQKGCINYNGLFCFTTGTAFFTPVSGCRIQMAPLHRWVSVSHVLGDLGSYVNLVSLYVRT